MANSLVLPGLVERILPLLQAPDVGIQDKGTLLQIVLNLLQYQVAPNYFAGYRSVLDFLKATPELAQLCNQILQLPIP
jgi:hypothetical protein